MLARFLRETAADVVMLAGRYTLLDQSGLDDVLPAAQEHDKSVVAVGVFNSGLLSREWPADGMKHDYQDAVPSLLLEEAAEHPAELALCLSRGLMDSRRRGREVSAWTAGAADLQSVAPALRDALADPDRRVRIAAAWAVGRLGDEASEPLLAQLAEDDDSQERAFAREALARLEARVAARDDPDQNARGATSRAVPPAADR